MIMSPWHQLHHLPHNQPHHPLNLLPCSGIYFYPDDPKLHPCWIFHSLQWNRSLQWIWLQAVDAAIHKRKNFGFVRPMEQYRHNGNEAESECNKHVLVQWSEKKCLHRYWLHVRWFICKNMAFVDRQKEFNHYNKSWFPTIRWAFRPYYNDWTPFLKGIIIIKIYNQGSKTLSKSTHTHTHKIVYEKRKPWKHAYMRVVLFSYVMHKHQHLLWVLSARDFGKFYALCNQIEKGANSTSFYFHNLNFQQFSLQK